MRFLKRITVRNFRCLRQEVSLDLHQSTYLVGANNSGKTAFLAAVRCFFDTSAFKPSDLNKTEFVAKQKDFNATDISIEFDTTVVEGKARKKRMLTTYGEAFTVKKTITYREVSNTVSVEYTIGNKRVQFFNGLDKDVQDALNAVVISYIHPQEGGDLLAKAQGKFKQRLFHNWGRHASVSEQLRELQKQWSELRKTANAYLSATLTENLHRFWPGSSTVIDLPENIEDIVAVSDISFRSSASLPEVTLTSQGTGAQSIVLYQTHYLLDSDRSLHRGFYVPIWLLEEPESFLHGDITIKLGNLLASAEWLGSIQMLTSTHSPIVLACSRQNPDIINWAILDDHRLEKQILVKDVADKDIENVAKLMGDSNFEAYFAASQHGPLLFIEDKRPLTKEKFEEAGLSVTKAFDGTSEAKKYLDVFRTIDGFAAKVTIILLDNDKGTKEFGPLLTAAQKTAEKDGFSLYKVGGDAFVMLMPKMFAAEDLFAEFDGILEDCISKIFNNDYDLRPSVPTTLARAAGTARRIVGEVNDMNDAKRHLRNEQDVKDIFWKKVKSSNYQINKTYVEAIKALIDAAR